MNRRKNHRALSVFLALALVSSLVAGTGFAASASETEDSYSEEVTAVETPDYEAEADSAEVLPSEDGEAVLTGEEAEATDEIEAEEADATETVEAEEPEAYLVSEETAASIQARIDALPSIEEYAELDSDAQNEVYAEAQELYDLYEALSAEEQEQVDTEKLYVLLDYFSGQIEMIDEDSHSHDGVEGTWTAISSTTTISEDGNYYISDDFTGYITISTNVTATLCLNGKTITAPGEYNHNDAIIINEDATLTLEDCSESGTGKITMSDGKIGRLVFVQGGNFIMNGGTIADCKGFNETNYYPGPGVYVSNYYKPGSFTMNGGTISNCKGVCGGGVLVNNNCTFTMNGGTIESCSASESNFDSSGYGGGVYVGINATFTMTGGTITGCEASYSGGGIYVGKGSALYLTNAAIYQNTANSNDTTSSGTPYGGGIAAGATADVTIYDCGAVVYGNVDNGSKNAQQIYIEGTTADYNLFVSKYYLGGGEYNWTDASGSSVDVYSLDRSGEIILNNSLSSDDSGVQAAMNKATALIYGNTGLIGGGIACNGSLIIGTGKTIDIPVSKTWVGDDETKRPESITVNLLLGETVVTTAELTKENNWSYTFTVPEVESGLSYSVQEVAVDGYTSTVTGSVEDGFTITNTKTETRSVTAPELTGTKVYAGKNFEDGETLGFDISKEVWKDGDTKQETSDMPDFKISFEQNGEQTSAAYASVSITYHEGNGDAGGYFTVAYKDANGEIVYSYDSENVITETVYDDGSKSYSFDFDMGNPTFDSAGSYTYGIKETTSRLAGVLYDASIRQITYTVGEEEGALKLSSADIFLGLLSNKIDSWTGEGGINITWTNKYAYAGFAPEITVRIVNEAGESVSAAGTYNFGLYASGAYDEETGTLSGNLVASKSWSAGADDTEGTVTFAKYMVEYADYKVIMTYYIKEIVPITPPASGVMTYDDSIIKVEIVVEPAIAGSLYTSSVTYTNLKSGERVVETYNAAEELTSTTYYTYDETTGDYVESAGANGAKVLTNIYTPEEDSEPEPEPTTTDLTVKKVWTLDDGGTAAAFVAVNLLKNGTVYATVTLDENNNWTYTWSGLDDSYTWTVEEADVPDSFTSSTTHSGTTWTITNDDVPEDTDEPDEPDTPDTPSNPDNPDTPSTPDSPSNPNTPSTPDRPLDNVPQTGDNTNLSLWLTLMFLALAGMAVTVIVGRRTRYCGAHEAKRRKR